MCRQCDLEEYSVEIKDGKNGSNYDDTYVRCKGAKMLRNMDKIVKMTFEKIPFFNSFSKPEYG